MKNQLTLTAFVKHGCQWIEEPNPFLDEYLKLKPEEKHNVCLKCRFLEPCIVKDDLTGDKVNP